MNRIPAHVVYGLLHVGFASGLAVFLPDGPWGLPTVLVPVLSGAILVTGRTYGPCLGLAGAILFLCHAVALTGAWRRLDADAVLLAALLPAFLSTGFRAVAARARLAPPPAPARPFTIDDAAGVLAVPFAVAGLGLPLTAVLRRAAGWWPLWTLPTREAAEVCVLAALVAVGVFLSRTTALLARSRRLSVLEAKILLLEAAREPTAGEEAAVWRRLLRFRARRARSPR